MRFPETHRTDLAHAARHKGVLASLRGIESGEVPLDVVFTRPGDALIDK